MGEVREKFLFHKSLLCDLAPFFRAALEGSFKEATEAMIPMPEEDPETVQRFHVWAYTGCIMAEDEDIKTIEWEALIQLYIFGEKYGLPDLQNLAIDSLVTKGHILERTPIEQLHLIYPIEQLHLIYNNTISTSPLRRWVIDSAAQKGLLDDWFTSEDLEARSKNYPLLFMMDLAREQYRLAKAKTKRHDWGALGCTFHVHPSRTMGSKQDLAKTT